MGGDFRPRAGDRFDTYASIDQQLCDQLRVRFWRVSHEESRRCDPSVANPADLTTDRTHVRVVDQAVRSS